MAYPVTNSTGWAELFNGNILSASYTMYNTYFNGWVVGILFIVFEILLLTKTRNPTLCFAVGLLFGALYGVSNFVVQINTQIIVVVLIFLCAATLYSLFNK